MSIKVKCRAERMIYHNNDFYIWAFSPFAPYSDNLKLSQYLTFSCKGDLSWVVLNKEYELVIEEDGVSKYGTSYKVIEVPSMSCEDLENLSHAESMEILREFTTERQASNILKAYPNFIWKILNEGKDSIDIKQIYGVGEAYLNCYARELFTRYKYIGLMNKLKDYKIDISDCKTLLDIYPTEMDIFKAFAEAPYKVLIGDLSKSFTHVDKLLMEIRSDLKESEQRCAYMILSVLDKTEADGSTRLNGNDLYAYIEDECNVPELLPLVVETAKHNELFYFDEKSCDIAKATTYTAECRIANFIKNRLKNDSKLDIDWTKYTKVDDFEMSAKQASALEMTCNHRVMILSGFSGSGKTTSLKGVVSMLEDNGLTYTLLAPTGKASMRMAESTHRTASTIHRKALKDKEITTDYCIIDEMSMVDLPTFIMWLNIISEDTRVIFVGDPCQLCPVGIGNIFNDMIESNTIPNVMLDEVFRYKTNGGLFVATNVRQGKEFFSDSEMVKQNGNVYAICNNYKFIQTPKEDILKVVMEEYMKLIDKGVKPNEILCLSPYNVGDEGSYRINASIQSEINAPKPNETVLTRTIDKGNNNFVTFRKGDRLLNKKNDYQILPLESWNEIENSNGRLTTDDVALTSVFNGQDGVIRDVDEKKLVAQFEEELVVFDKYKLSNLLLGYCISVHSSQGSEAKYVINVVSPSHKRMLNRNLLYVADTRSKVMQIDIGDMATYNYALHIDGREERDTWLKELLIDGLTNSENSGIIEA